MFTQLGLLNGKKRTSLLELLVAIVVVSLVAWILLDRLLYYQEAAEKAKVEYQISALKSGLRVRMADLMMQGRAREFASLDAENPFDWLADKPAGFRYRSVDLALNPEPGTWYFESSTRTVLYVPLNDRHFSLDGVGKKQVRLKIELAINQRSNEDAAEPRVLGATLKLVEPYRWM